MRDAFRKFSNRVSTWTGTAGAFVIALAAVVSWALTGPVFNFSSTWQLVINTATTIVTFLMVFLIQNTQNRDGKAMQLKLDEIILATRARDSFVDLEDMSDAELHEIDEEFKRLRDKKVITAPALHKLHSRIQAAKKHRQSLTERTQKLAGEFAEAINPFEKKD